MHVSGIITVISPPATFSEHDVRPNPNIMPRRLAVPVPAPPGIHSACIGDVIGIHGARQTSGPSARPPRGGHSAGHVTSNVLRAAGSVHSAHDLSASPSLVQARLHGRRRRLRQPAPRTATSSIPAAASRLRRAVIRTAEQLLDPQVIDVTAPPDIGAPREASSSTFSSPAAAGPTRGDAARSIAAVRIKPRRRPRLRHTAPDGEGGNDEHGEQGLEWARRGRAFTLAARPPARPQPLPWQLPQWRRRQPWPRLWTACS